MKSASRTLLSTFGTIIGLMGIEHGLGEILQGQVVPAGYSFPSWPDSQFFAILSGEPAFSIIPNMLVTGLLAFVFSLCYVVWSLFFIQNKHSRMVMISLAILMFLTGGGFFPPFFCTIIAFFADRLHRPVPFQKNQPSRLLEISSVSWPWVFGLCLAFWLAMFPGVPVLDYFFNIYNEIAFFIILVGMVVSLILANFAAKARDIQTSRQK